jgi:L1 cell adhesion molecule like protein
MALYFNSLVRMSSTVGIDLGTAYCRVSIVHDHQVVIVTNDGGKRRTPSCVAFRDDQLLVGDVVKDQTSTNPTKTVFDVTRLIGRNFSDPIVQDDMKRWPFRVVRGYGDQPQIEVELRGEMTSFQPEEIIGMILSKMKKMAEGQLKEKVRDVVLTVPTCFNDVQRQATKDAAAIAGLNVIRIMTAPNAAAHAFGWNEKHEGEREVLIFDFGGGYLNVSLVDIDDVIIEVRATAGNPHLGGIDFDDRMVMFFADRFKQKFKKDLRQSPPALMRLRTACEQPKCILSTATSASIVCDSLYEGCDFMDNISRSTF